MWRSESIRYNNIFPLNSHSEVNPDVTLWCCRKCRLVPYKHHFHFTFNDRKNERRVRAQRTRSPWRGEATPLLLHPIRPHLRNKSFSGRQFVIPLELSHFARYTWDFCQFKQTFFTFSHNNNMAVTSAQTVKVSLIITVVTSAAAVVWNEF